MAQTQITQTAVGNIEFHDVPGLQNPLEQFNYATVAPNGMVYLSCVQGFKPGTLTLVSDKPEEQTKQVLANMQHILSHVGSSLETVVKFTLLLKDMEDFPQVNAEIVKAFGNKMPARSSIQAVIPKGCKVAIDCVALQTDK